MGSGTNGYNMSHEVSETNQLGPTLGGTAYNSYGQGNASLQPQGTPLFPQFFFEQSQYPNLQQADQAAAQRSLFHGHMMNNSFPMQMLYGQQGLYSNQGLPLLGGAQMPAQQPQQQNGNSLQSLLSVLLMHLLGMQRPFDTSTP